MRASVLILALSLLGPGAAIAGEKSEDPGSKVICKTLDVTGSRVHVNRVCKTRAQWRAEAERASDQALARQQSRVGYGGPGSASDPK